MALQCAVANDTPKIAFAPKLNLEKVLFVSVLPRVAPRFKKDGTVGGYDDVISAKNRTKINGVLNKQYGQLIGIMDVFFDIKDVKQKKTKVEFYDIIVENLDEFVVNE